MKIVRLGVFALFAAVGCREQPTAPPDNTSLDVTSQAQDDYVATPAGLYHRSCVHLIPDGAKIDKSLAVTRRDGTQYQIPPCAHPTKGAFLRAQQPNAQVGTPTTSGWVEFSSTTAASGTFRKISANWTVPAAPGGSYASNQVYYTFPGLQGGGFILQPVLTYGYAPDYGGSYWTIASWRCNDGSTCVHSTPRTVTAGSGVSGSVVASNCVGSSCTWKITTRVTATGDSTLLTITDNDDKSLATGGAVEVYNLNSCNQYPVNGVFYTGVSLFNASLTQVYPTWSSNVTGGLTPQCGFAVTSPSTDIVNLYHTAAAPSLSSLSTNPSPVRQYVPAAYTINGSGFNPATVEALIYGAAGSSCPPPGACVITNSSFTTKTSTQLYAPSFSLSIPGTYTLRVHNGAGGYESSGIDYTIVHF